jgi:hypothetical protein
MYGVGKMPSTSPCGINCDAAYIASPIRALLGCRIKIAKISPNSIPPAISSRPPMVSTLWESVPRGLLAIAFPDVAFPFKGVLPIYPALQIRQV